LEVRSDEVGKVRTEVGSRNAEGGKKEGEKVRRSEVEKLRRWEGREERCA
jgi:hypothetical protein